MKPAYAYLRCSTKTNEDGDTFPRQREAIERYAAGVGIEIAGEYADTFTGTVVDRDQMAAMLLDMEVGKVKTFIVESPSRLARDLMVQESIVRDCTNKGIEILSAAGDELTNPEPSRVFIRQVLAAFSQLERSLLVAKLKAARDRKKKTTGRCEGAKPYGSLMDEGIVIAQIRRQRSMGMSWVAIANRLNEEGKRLRSGREFTGVRVYRILYELDQRAA